MERVHAQRSVTKGLSVLIRQSELGDARLMSLRDAAMVATRRVSAFVVEMPAGFAREQAAAIARRFGCSEDDWATIRRVSRVYVCTCCARVKNFYLGERAKASAVRASGYEKLVCQSPLDLGRVVTDAPLACASTPACRMFRAESHDLLSPQADGGVLGGLLQLSSACLTVSRCCGMLASLSVVRATAGGQQCPACRPKEGHPLFM